MMAEMTASRSGSIVRPSPIQNRNPGPLPVAGLTNPAHSTKIRKSSQRVGLWRSWERASMAWKRSSVRSRSGPPILHHPQNLFWKHSARALSSAASLASALRLAPSLPCPLEDDSVEVPPHIGVACNSGEFTCDARLGNPPGVPVLPTSNSAKVFVSSQGPVGDGVCPDQAMIEPPACSLESCAEEKSPSCRFSRRPATIG